MLQIASIVKMYMICKHASTVFNLTPSICGFHGQEHSVVARSVQKEAEVRRSEPETNR